MHKPSVFRTATRTSPLGVPAWKGDAITCAAILLLSCSPGVAQAAELRFSLGSDPKTFDPLDVSEQNSEYIRYLTAGVLVRLNRVTGKVEPELAESFRI